MPDMGLVAPTGMKPRVDHRRIELVAIDNRRWRDYHDVVWDPEASVERRREVFEAAMESLEALLAHDRERRG